MSLILPEPVAGWFAAEHDPHALALCLAPQAVLQDEGRTYTGVDAISTFMAEAAAKYDATTVPFALDWEDGSLAVRAKVSGNFPGSPIDLTYRFRLEGGLIAALEISA